MLGAVSAEDAVGPPIFVTDGEMLAVYLAHAETPDLHEAVTELDRTLARRIITPPVPVICTGPRVLFAILGIDHRRLSVLVRNAEVVVVYGGHLPLADGEVVWAGHHTRADAHGVLDVSAMPLGIAIIQYLAPIRRTSMKPSIRTQHLRGLVADMSELEVAARSPWACAPYVTYAPTTQLEILFSEGHSCGWSQTALPQI